MPKRTKSPEGARKTQLKISVTRPFKDGIDRFLNEHRELISMTDLTIVAIQYFMQQYLAAGCRRDERGFPAASTSETLFHAHQLSHDHEPDHKVTHLRRKDDLKRRHR